MIDKIIVGRGNKRTVVNMVRDKEQRRGVAKALIGHLFPTSADYQRAKRQGEQRARKFKDGFKRRVASVLPQGGRAAYA